MKGKTIVAKDDGRIEINLKAYAENTICRGCARYFA